MTPQELVQTIFAGIGIIWLPIQVLISFRQAQKTSDLGHKVQRLNTELDQRIQRLYRLRELLNKYTYYFTLMEITDEHIVELSSKESFEYLANVRVNLSEMSGLLRVINDKMLLEEYTKIHDLLNATEYTPSDKDVRPILVNLHTRVYQLLEETTK